ncbi:hypothetical protein [Alkalihalobacillus sp. LMS39]|uniref:hypothetical protein n=1 Tax=Alkalihalobacillus sp. LMS39 TaxID=2924032 RepID=UPI001FB2513E|nr:hypothetical protein [Alkalihalobacillus sp. LMS39]UOE94811.1 hypothetical protein MM271_03960 [Alkalihalobacillus sp. LMS39]
MNIVNMLFLGLGFLFILLSLVIIIVKLTKGNHVFSPLLVSCIVFGFLSVIAGVVFMVLDGNENVVQVTTKDVEQLSSEIEVKKVNEEIEMEPGLESHENDLLKVARELVTMEMDKQIGLKTWEITENYVYSDYETYNIIDYDKPEGDMRVVWIVGNVKATSEDEITVNFSYDLELYQMDGDSTWYIGTHWGILSHLKITEIPNSESIIAPTSETVSSQGSRVEQTDLIDNEVFGAWHWNDGDDFYMILRDDYTYSYIEKNVRFVTEGTFSIKEYDDGYEITVHHMPLDYYSVMFIKLLDNDRHQGFEDGFSWDAIRINVEVAEEILNSIKGI